MPVNNGATVCRVPECPLSAGHWACGFCPSKHPGGRYYYHPHLAEQPARCREGKGLGPNHAGRVGSGVLFLTSGPTRLESGWGRRERKGQVCTADKGLQPTVAGDRPQLCMGDSFSRAAEGPEALGSWVCRQSSWALPALGSKGVVVSGYKGNPNLYPSFTRGRSWRGKELSGKGRPQCGGAYFCLFPISQRQEAISACSVPHTSGLCSGPRALSGQMAVAEAKGLGCPWPTGRAGGCRSGRWSLSLVSWAGLSPGVQSRVGGWRGR